MVLVKTYNPEFERLYREWPTYPKGRTRKHLAAKAFEKAKKDFELTSTDIDELVLLIDRMKRDRKSWQKGNSYGPQGLQVWLNQAGWQDDYEKVYTRTSDRYDKANKEDFTETHEEAMRKIRQAEAERARLH